MSVALALDPEVAATHRRDLFELVRSRLRAQQRVFQEVSDDNTRTEERFQRNHMFHGFALELAAEQNRPVNRDGSVTLSGLFGQRTFSPAQREVPRTVYEKKFMDDLKSQEGFIVAHLHCLFGSKAPQALAEFYHDLRLSDSGRQRAESLRESVGQNSYHVDNDKQWTPVAALVDLTLPASSIVAKIEDQGIIDRQIAVINRMEKSGLMCDMSATRKWLSKLGL